MGEIPVKIFARRAVIGAAVLALAAGAAFAQSGDGQDRRVRIINDTGVTMTHFYASDSRSSDWEEDILGRDVLPSGRSVVINIDDGSGACIYDFRARFADGDVLERFQINVCRISEYRYH